MKVKIVIQTMKPDQPGITRSEVWSGEMEILDDTEYLAKLSIIAEGHSHPVVDMPFAIGIGYYVWIPPSVEMEDRDEGWNLNG